MNGHEHFLRAMAELYRQADEAISRLGVECRACGKCCNFATNDYVLYASAPEAAYLVALFPEAAGRRLSEGRCSLQVAGLCSVHAARPLGCRTHFCQRAQRDALQALYEAFYQRLKQVAAACAMPWSYCLFLPE